MDQKGVWADRIARMREEHGKHLEAELPRLVDGLVRLGARKVILFGSMTRGRAGIASDLDLIAVIPTGLGPVERLAWVYQELSPRGADILVYTPDEFDRGSSFIRHATRTGKVMYDA
jgi:predicted nucleotidyltransferase